jgi:hypothetical protein
MASVTGGEIRGTVVTPGQRGPTFIGKLGVDRQVNKDLRLRLTGSMYRADKAMSNTLYGGDRAGSRYYWVMENTARNPRSSPRAWSTPNISRPRNFTNGFNCSARTLFLKPGLIRVRDTIRHADSRPRIR